MFPTKINTLHCLLWMCVLQSSQCFLFINTLRRTASKVLPFSTRPITLRVPTNRVGDTEKVIKDDRQPNSDIFLVSKGSSANQPNTGISRPGSITRSVLRTTSGLPARIYDGDQEYKTTTRAQILRDRLSGLGRSMASLPSYLPFTDQQNVPVTYPKKSNAPDKPKKREVSEKEKREEKQSKTDKKKKDQNNGDSNEQVSYEYFSEEVNEKKR